jgi:hypothetical protein
LFLFFWEKVGRANGVYLLSALGVRLWLCEVGILDGSEFKQWLPANEGKGDKINTTTLGVLLLYAYQHSLKIKLVAEFPVLATKPLHHPFREDPGVPKATP